MAVSKNAQVQAMVLQGNPWEVSLDGTNWLLLTEGGDVDQAAPQDNTTTVRTAGGFVSHTTPGVAQPLTIAVPALPAQSPAIQLLRNAQNDSKRVWLRQVVPPNGVYKPVAAALTIEITAAGVATFAGTELASDLIPALRQGTYGPGSIVAADSKVFIMSTVPAVADVDDTWTGADMTLWDGTKATLGTATPVAAGNAISSAENVDAIVEEPGYTIGPVSGKITGMNQMNQTVDGVASISSVSFDLGGAQLIPTLGSFTIQTA